MRQRVKTSTILAALTVCASCATYPDADDRFLNRDIPVGSDAGQARLILDRRRFDAVGVRSYPRKTYDRQSGAFTTLPMSFGEVVRQNLEFVPVRGRPEGELECFARRYSVFLSAGVRKICWTHDASGGITWRQAGARLVGF